MRKFLSVFMILVVLLSLGCVLVACINDEPPEETPPATATKTTMDIFDAISARMPGGALSTDLSVKAKVGKQNYQIGIRMNNPTNLEQINKFEFVFDIRKDNKDGEVVFATYIVNSKVYVGTRDLKIYLDDFDVDFLVNMFKQIPSFEALLDGILSNIVISGEAMSIDSIIQLVVPMLFSDKPYYSEKDGVIECGVEIVLTNFAKSILGLLGGVGLDGTIQSLLNMPVSDTPTPLGDFLAKDIGALVEQFPFKVMLDCVMRPGESPEIAVDWSFLNTEANILDVQVKANIYDKKQDLGIPDDLAVSFDKYSVFNLGMDLTITAALGKAGVSGPESYLDLGALINIFAGEYDEIIPSNVPLRLYLDQSALKLSLQTQLDRHNNANNLFKLEISGGFIDTENGDIPVLIGLYYIDGAFYLKMNLNNGPGNVGLYTPVVKFTGIDLSQMLDAVLGGGEIIDGTYFEGIGNVLQNLIMGLITGNAKVEQSAINTEPTQMEASSLLANTYNTDNSSSDNLIMPLIYKLIGIFGFEKELLGKGEDYFGLDFYPSDEDNASFFQSLINLLPNSMKTGLIGGLFESDIMQKLEGYFRFYYGNANVDIGQSKTDLAKIELALTTGANKDIVFGIKADNFRFGKPDDGLKDYIKAELNNQETTDNLSELIANILKGASISIDFNIQINQGDVNLNEILAPLKIVGLPQLPIINIPKDLDLTFRLDLAFAFNAASPSSSMFKLELILTKVMSGGVSDESAFPYMKVGKPALGLYSTNGSMYVDLSGIKLANLSLPKLRADVDIMSMLAEQLNNIDINFSLSEIIDLIKPPVSDDARLGSNFQAPSYNFNGDGNTEEDYNGIGGSIAITKDGIMVVVTSMAIMNVLKQIVDVDFDLPNMILDMQVGGKNSDGANVIFDLNVTLKDNSYQDLMRIGLSVKKFNIGKIDNGLMDFFNEFDTTDYETDILAIAKKLLGHVNISAEIEMITNGDSLDLTELINNVLAIANQRIDFPIVIDIANFKDKLNFVLQWNLNSDPRKSELILELFSENGKPTSANGYKATGLALGIYIKNGELLIDLSQLGITKIKYVDFDVNKLVDIILEGALGGLGLDMNNLNLTTILGDLLADILPTATPQTATFADNYKVSAYNAAVEGISVGDELVNSLLDAVLNNLVLTNSTLSLSLISKVIEENGNTTVIDPIKDILYSLGIDAGVDIGLAAAVDLEKGQLALNLGIQNTEFNLKFNINNIGGTGTEIDWANKDGKHWVSRDESAIPEKFKFSTFADVSSTSLFELLLNTLGNVTNDAKGDWKALAVLSTRIKHAGNGTDSQDLTVEIFKANKAINDSSMGFSKGDLRIVAYRTNSDGNNKIAIATVRFDIKGSALHIKLQNGILGNNSAFKPILSSIAPIVIALPLNTLEDILPDFEIPTIGATNANRLMSNEYLAEEAPAMGLDTFFDSDHGIRIAFGNNNDVKVRADVKGTFLSDMLTNMLGKLFKPYGVEYTTLIKQINYNNYEKIVDQLYEKFLRTFIDQAIGSSISWLLAAEKENIKNVLRRVLPIPIFSEASLEVNLIEGAFSTLKLRTYVTAADRIEDRNNYYTKDKSNIAIDLVNNVTVGRVDWMGQSTDIINVIDTFGTNEQNALRSQFVDAVWMNVNNSNHSLGIRAYSMINFEDTGYKKLYNALASETAFKAFINDPANQIQDNGDGSYTYQFNLITNGGFNSGGIYSKDPAKLPIKIKLVTNLPVTSIDDVLINATNTLPDAAGNLTTDIVARYTEKDSFGNDIDKKIILNKTITGLKDDNAITKDNGDKVYRGKVEVLTGMGAKSSQMFDVNVILLSDKTEKFNGSMNVFLSQKTELLKIIGAAPNQTKVSSESLKDILGIPKIAYFKYDSSPVWRSAIIESWDLSEVLNQTADYYSIKVVANLKGGSKVNYYFNMVSNDVVSVSFGGENFNTLYIDPLKYWDPNSWKKNTIVTPESGVYDKTANSVFRANADIIYRDGRIVNEAISWNADNIASFIATYEATPDLLDGKVYGNSIITPKSTVWNNDKVLVELAILNRKNPTLIFGQSNGDDITSLTASPYDNTTELLTRTAIAEYADGVRIDVDIKPNTVQDLPINGALLYVDGIKVYPKYFDTLRHADNEESKVGEYVVNDSLIGSTTIPIIVEKCIVNDLVDKAPIKLNSISRFLFRDRINNGVSSITDLLPQTYAFTVNGDEKKSFDITYSGLYKEAGSNAYNGELDKYIDTNATTITVNFRITNNTNANEFPYEMQVVIPDRTIHNDVVQRPVTIAYNEYISKSNKGVSNRVTVTFGKGETANNDTLIIDQTKNTFDFAGIDLTKTGDNKGTFAVTLTDDVKVRIPLNVTRCPEYIPIGLASGYDTLIFNKAQYFSNQVAGKESENYSSKTLWKLTAWKDGAITDLEVGVGKTYGIKWEYTNIKPNAANQTVTLKVTDSLGNVIASYTVKLIFI